MPNRRPSIGRFAPLALALLLAPAFAGAAEAQDSLAGELAVCRTLEDPTERLRCYDAAAEAEAETGQVVVEGQEALLELAGSGDFDSEVFEPTAPWHLRWNTGGSIFTVELRDFTGQLINIIGNQIGRGEGRSDEMPPGGYMLAVRAIGDWQLWVIQED